MLEKYAIDELLNNDDCYMKCDVYVKDNNYYIDIDAPGYDKNNLLVEYNNGYIAVTVTKKEIKEDNKKYIKKERCYGVYKRQFYVGDIDTTKINSNE